MVGGSPFGDDVSGQSSPAAKADEIYSSIDKTTKWLSSRSTQAASPVACPSPYPPYDSILDVAAPFVSMAISGKPGLEVGEPPGGEEEDAVTMEISGEPGPEVCEPPPTLPPLFASSSARSGNTFSPSARWWLFHKALLANLRSAPNRID